MSREKRLLTRPMTITTLMLGVVAVVVMVMGTEAPAALALESCNTGNECVWDQTFYQGTRTEVNCIGGEHGLTTKWSAKNRCANKKVVLIWHEGEIFTEKACMNPGGNRPEPGHFNAIIVGAEGSRC